eukprot:gene9903-24718_t
MPLFWEWDDEPKTKLELVCGANYIANEQRSAYAQPQPWCN